MLAKNIDNLGKVSKAEDGTFRVRVRYTIPGGKTMDIKKRAKTKREAQVILEVLLQEAKVNLGAKTIHFSEYTVEQYFKKVFLPFKERKIKAQSYRRLESIVDTHIIPAHGKRIFCKLQSDDITALLDRLTEKGYSYSTIKKVHDAYSAVYSFAVNKMSDLPSDMNPMRAVALEPESNFEKKEILWFQPQEVVRFAEYAEKVRSTTGTPFYEYGYVYLFLMATGLRVGEVCALNKSDFNFEKKLMNINKGLVSVTDKDENGKKHYSLQVETPKTSNSIRCIPLSDEALYYARKIMNLFPKGELFIYGKTEKYVRPDCLTKQFKKILDAAGLEPRGMHSLRHTFVSLLFEKDVDTHTIAALIGDQESTVRKTYLHLYQERKARAMNAINIIKPADFRESKGERDSY